MGSKMTRSEYDANNALAHDVTSQYDVDAVADMLIAESALIERIKRDRSLAQSWGRV